MPPVNIPVIIVSIIKAMIELHLDQERHVFLGNGATLWDCPLQIYTLSTTANSVLDILAFRQ